MNVLVIGSGGREHALAWRLAQCASVSRVFVAPGNPGTARVATNLAVAAPRPDEYVALAREHAIHLTVVGPEAPLVGGVANAFEAAGLAIVGPSQAAAQLEGSKAFTKDLLDRAGVPTARYRTADDAQAARTLLSGFAYPVVLKADGLAAGKGVIIAHDKGEAEQGLKELAQYGGRVVVEEFLRGEEVSFIALCDGERAIPLEPAQDHKRLLDGDLGPNTGGMGAYSDSRLLSDAERDIIIDRVFMPVLATMRASGTPFRGFLYAGLMMTANGPMVLEFNVRLGDPEAQALLMRWRGDVAEALRAAAAGRVPHRLEWTPDPAACIVLASRGYPASPVTGDTIEGLDSAEQDGAVVFYAGTREQGGRIETAGGRVLGVTAVGASLQTALDRAYSAAAHIHFNGMQYRRDIGKKGLARW